jgi:capsid protein
MLAAPAAPSNGSSTNGPSKNGRVPGAHRPSAAELLFGGRDDSHVRRVSLSYDAARSGTDLDNHWAYADALDADAANSPSVRHTLMRRSRYETGSNGYYNGIERTYSNMLVGVGPTLRMLSKSRNLNQFVEREFWKWAQAVQLRRKLWAMAHARCQDGESFALLVHNPNVRHSVQLDLLLIEAEQVQTPMLPYDDPSYIDGINHDEFGNPLWYDVLPAHPGSSQFAPMTMQPERVPAASMLHWFHLERPGAGRGIPDMTSTLPVGASSRRHREATVSAAEGAAALTLVSQTTQTPGAMDAPDPVRPFSGVPLQKNTWLFSPMGWQNSQIKGEHPNAQYKDFHRLQISEMARPISMPYNAASCDSSTYSFASGKLDYLLFRVAIDCDREDANDLVLNRIFRAWFREWTILEDLRDTPPNHQWDWPLHPVIDQVAHSRAIDMDLRNGTRTLRQVFSDAGQDFEDQITVMAEDFFGTANDDTIQRMRQILLTTLYPAAAANASARLGRSDEQVTDELAALQARIEELEARLAA